MDVIPPAELLADPLTGALTRHAFDSLLGRGLEQALAEQACLALLVIDIDHFKSINDSFGHVRGDAVLIEVARRMREALRAGDLLFRFGGDEFVVLVPAPTRSHALQVAERMLTSVQHAPFNGDPPLSLTLSIGVATFPDDADSAEALLLAADRHVYHAKRAGRGRVSEGEDQTRQVPLASPARLIEREDALAAARELLTTSDTTLRSLCVRATPGSGRTRLLAELVRAAASLGYATLSISGDAALRARRYGALVRSATDWPTPAPADGLEPFAAALAQAARSRGANRLLITIDDPGGIDASSLDFLYELAAMPILPRIVLIYVDGPVWASRVSRESLPQQTIMLAPLTPQGIKIWLRQMLRWEPPDSLIDWVTAYSDGYPGRIQRAVDELIGTGALTSRGAGWVWDASLALGIPPYAVALPAILKLLDTAPSLVGRDHEMVTLHNLLLAHRIVTVVGPGGVGKTRLTLQAAAECHADFRDGVHLVALAGVQQITHIPAAITAALELPPLANTDPHTRLVKYLSGREILLVLDNFEHLIDGAALLTELLRAAPQLRVLITSRERLNLPDECVYTIDGLTLPSDDQHATAAVQLFYQRAQQVNTSFTTTAEDAQVIGRICRLLNGLPLGIELAASLCQTYTIPTILAELERSLSFLIDTRAEQPDRHRSLTAVLDSFWEIFSPHERRALQSLAVFRSGFTREAARIIAGASPFFLDGLAAKTVIRRGSSGRFTIHELLRQYAAEKLHANRLAEARIYDRHSAYYLQWLAGHPEMLEPQLEIDNLRAAWEWAVARCNIVRIGNVLHAFFSLLIDMGLLREGLATNAAAYQQLEHPCMTEGRQDVLTHLGVMRSLILHHMGRYTEAVDVAQQAEALLGNHVAPLVRARAHYAIGTSQMICGDQQQAQERLVQALPDANGDDRLAVEILYTLTHLANLEGDSARADSYGRVALQRARRAGDQRAEHQVLLFLGIGRMLQERHAEARAYLEPIVAQPGTIRQAMTDTLALLNLAQISWEVQEYRRGAAEVERAIGLARMVDMYFLEGIGRRVRGIIALSTGRLAQAEAALTEAVAIFGALNAERDMARTQMELALLEIWCGRYTSARAMVEAALATARSQQFIPIEGHALIHRGHALLGLGDPLIAAESYRAGHALFLALGRRNRAMEAWAGLIEVDLACDRRTAALHTGREVLAHLAAGRPALHGMYDPARVCLAVADALSIDDPDGARSARAMAVDVLEHTTAQLEPERARRDLAHIPALRRLIQL